MPDRRWIPVLAVGLVLVIEAGPTAQSTSRLTFIGVTLDADTRQADRRLTEYLFEKAGIRFAAEELEYGQAIRRVVNWRREDDFFVARMTPYVYVVAELLGANIEPLATYVNSKTSRTTYRSYFVVNRSGFASQPDLSDLLRFVASRESRPKFVYQSEFSTSSYFLPSLFFRANHVFHMPEAIGRLRAIGTEKMTDVSSATLVERVARGEADIAAVWDGVKARFESEPAHVAVGRQVYFIPLPTQIPNDLLVSAGDLDADAKARLRKAIDAMPPDSIDVGDFLTWRSLSAAEEARQALGELRQSARAAATRVPIEIALAPGAPAPAAPLLEAARQAVRLSETEFTVFDADFHHQPDLRWTLEPIHDGAVVLHSVIPGYGVDEQAFQLSFRDDHDLTARIVSLIQSRIHRIRYVWPFSASDPIVIRDSAFAMPVGTPVKVQRITWIDPDRNQFLAGDVFESRIKRATFYRYELEAEDFVRPTGGVRPNPLSNDAFRVVLVRPAERPFLFRALAVALVACFLLAGAAAAWSLFGRAPAQRGPATQSS